MCDFGRRHLQEQFCETILNLDPWLRRRCCLKTFLIYSSGCPFVRQSRSICPILVEGTLCEMLGVQEGTAALCTRSLRWYGHVARSSSCINSITSMTIPSARRRGRPKKTWSECVKADMKMCSLGSINPLNREAWRLGVRHSSRLLPTPVPGTPAAVEK